MRQKIIQISITFLLFTFFISDSFAQEAGYTNEIKIAADNDVFVFFRDSDQYYSYGISIDYSFKTTKFLGLQTLFRNKQDVFYTLRAKLEGYTPSRVLEFAKTQKIETPDYFDRPYAGLLYSTISSTYTFTRSFLKTELLVGILGPDSQAGDIQNWYHRNITGDLEYDGWQFQIENQLILNLNLDYVYNFNPKNSILNLYGKGSLKLGNLYLQTSPSLGFRIGKFEKITRSTGFGNSILLLKKNNEFFFNFNIESRFNVYNATIQGNIFEENSFSSGDLNNISWHISNGLYYSKNQISVNVIYSWSSGVLNQTDNHVFGTITASYRF